MPCAGTPTHMAPEVYTYGHMSPAADVFSFGVLLHELVSGNVPGFTSPEEKRIVALPADCLPAFTSLVHHCLAHDRAER